MKTVIGRYVPITVYIKDSRGRTRRRRTISRKLMNYTVHVEGMGYSRQTSILVVRYLNGIYPVLVEKAERSAGSCQLCIHLDNWLFP